MATVGVKDHKHNWEQGEMSHHVSPRLGLKVRWARCSQSTGGSAQLPRQPAAW